MKHLKRHLLALVLLVSLSAITASARYAQPHHAPQDAQVPPTAATQPSAEKAAEPQSVSPEAKPAEAPKAADAQEAGKKEEKEEDGEAAFKYSASVRKLAELTGLSVTSAYWVFVLINFAIVAGVILGFMKKKLPGAFRGRTASIQQQILEARKASEDANRRLAEIEARLSRLGTDIESMRSEGEAAARAEEERLRASAEEERKRMVSGSEAEITAAANAARRELKIFTAELAVSLAEKRIRVEDSADQVLVKRFTERLGKDGQ